MDITAIQQVNPARIQSTGPGSSGDRPAINWFVSYSHRDKRLVSRFQLTFEEQLALSRHFTHRLWRDTQLLPGRSWWDDIHTALDACDAGILLVSPSFLVSDFINAEELVRFVGPDADKPVIPVVLRDVDPTTQDLRGLESLQLFMLDQDHWQLPKSYQACTGIHRDTFVRKLVESIDSRLLSG